jgi:hypothetical protein
LVVGKEGLLIVRVREDLTVRDVSHKQLDDHLELQDLGAEGLSADIWTLADGLDQTGLSLRVLKLDGLYAPKVVEISGVLII